MTTFVPGQKLATRSMANYDCVFRFTVISRTAKFVTLDDGYDTYRVKIKIWDNAEVCMPYGMYSMAPVLVAGKNIEDGDQ